MKYTYTEQEYSQLLSEQRYAYERIINNLESHISWLKDELDELKGGDKLAQEIAKLEGQPQIILNDCQTQGLLNGCPGCDAAIRELREENAKLKEEIASLKKTAKAKAPKRKYTRHKQALCTCKDCGTYFYAQRKDAKRCPECKRKHINQAKKEWAKKQRAAKEM